MTFDELLSQITVKDGKASIELPDSWTQGRSTFGGIQIAMGLRAMRQMLPAYVPLRSVVATFVAPVGQGAVDIDTRVLRQGRNVTHVQAELLAEGEVVCTLTGCFGHNRESAIDIQQENRPADLPGPDGLHSLPHIPGVTPNFLSGFDLRWAKGNYPFTATRKEAETGIWMRIKGNQEMEDLHIAALTDASPTPALVKLKKPAPASTLTWMVNIITDEYHAGPADWWFHESKITQMHHGYGQEDGRLWAPDGRLVAISRQVVTVFG